MAGEERLISKRRLDKGSVSLALLLGIVLLYSAVFGFYTVVRHMTFSSQAYDLGTFDQGIWLAGHSASHFITVRGLHLLGDHVRLISFVLAPIYYIWNDVRLLLILQSVAIALGALALFRAGRRDLPEAPFFVLMICAGYLLNPAVQNLNLDHAHPEAFATTLIIFSYCFLQTRRLLLFSLFMALAMMCKEDVPFVYFFLGIVTAIRGDRKVGAVMALAAALYFLLCIYAILPTFNEVGFFRTEVGHFTSAKGRFFDIPWLMNRLLVRENLSYLFVIGLPVAFLPFLSPVMLLPALPALLVNMLSHSPYMRSINYHYTTSIVPFLYLGTILAVKKCLYGDRPPWLPLPGLVEQRNGGATLLVAVRKWRIPRPLLYVTIVGLLLFCPVYSNLTYSKIPLNRLDKIRSRFEHSRTNPSVLSVHEIIDRIPRDAAVSADYTVVPHLSHRKNIYMYPNPFVPNYWGIREENPHDPEIIDTILLRESVVKPDKWAIVDSLVERGEFEMVEHGGGARLYKRRRPGSAPPEPTADATGGLVGSFYQFPRGFTTLPEIENRWPIFKALFPRIEFPHTKREFKSFDGIATGMTKHFVAVFTGDYQAHFDGEYYFEVTSDDGFRLRLNQLTVAEYLEHRAFRPTGGTVDLERGWVPIELAYFNNNPPAGLVLSVRPPDGVLAPVPPEDLRPPRP